MRDALCWEQVEGRLEKSFSWVTGRGKVREVFSWVTGRGKVEVEVVLGEVESQVA